MDRNFLFWAVAGGVAGCSAGGGRFSRLTGVVNAARILIGAPAAGVLAEVKARPGDLVAKDAVLAVIETPARARVEPLQRSAAAAGEQLETARRRLQAIAEELASLQAQPTVDRRVVGGRIVEADPSSALLRLELVRNRLMAAEVLEQSARRAATEARSALEPALAGGTGSPRIEVRAPEAGVVATGAGPAGRAVAAGQPIAVLYDTREMWVSVAIEESVVSSYRRGDRLEVELADGRQLTGVVRTIAPAPQFAVQRDADRLRRDIRSYEVELQLPPDDALLPGLTAYVRIPS